MDDNFQTSFIPKKPLAEERVIQERPVSIFSLVATIAFFVTLISAGGVYFYKITLTNQVASQTASLERAKAAFEPSLVETLQTLDKRINASKEILANHITASPILKSLEDLTLKSVRFTKFDYEISKDGGTKIDVTMTGQARSYTSIALQSDMLGQNKYIKNVVFSNLVLDAQGNVGFDLKFSVDPAFVMYGSTISNATATGNNNPITTNTTTP